MTSRSSFGRLPHVLVGATILIGVTLACGPAAPATPPIATRGLDATTAPASSAPPSASALAASSSAAGGPSPSVAGRDAPPDAALAAEGGDPVTGRLGTYLWLGTGSDSPWLLGAPLAVGAGEPLTLRLDPDADILAWTARSVPAGTQGPEGATTLAEGTGDPVFDAPGPGAWTVEVFVGFAGGAGEASYFWRLEVE
jgi:hypothetical protein